MIVKLSNALKTKRVVQDEPPKKKERKRGRCLVAPLMGYSMSKKIIDFNGANTVFYRYKRCIFFNMASIA